MILLQLAILLVCIFIGARMSGIGLGVMGMIGLLILLFAFKMQPADPPLEVMLIILSVVTAAAALQAAGGMDYLVNLAGKLLRSRPGQITILGPLVTYFFTLFAGTAHISYSILPIIAEVAIKKKNPSRKGIKYECDRCSHGHHGKPGVCGVCSFVNRARTCRN